MKYTLIIVSLLIIAVAAAGETKYRCDPTYCTTVEGLRCCTTNDICRITTLQDCPRSSLNATCDATTDCADDCCVGLACGSTSQCKALRDLGTAVGTAFGMYCCCLILIVTLIVVAIIAIIVCIVRSGRREPRAVNRVVVVEGGHGGQNMGMPVQVEEHH